MAKRGLTVCIHKEYDEGELYFKEEDQKLIQKLREKAEKEANEKYREEHSAHCFRCGTESLVEIDRGDVKIDICANDNCGAVHLDPGELEMILEDEKAIGIIRNTFINLFRSQKKNDQ